MHLSDSSFTLGQYELHPRVIIGNATPPELQEEALTQEPDVSIPSVEALIVFSYEKTGLDSKDKCILEYASIDKEVWQSSINIGMDEATFMICRGRAIDYLNTQQRIYVVHGYAGWDPKYWIEAHIFNTSP